MSAIDELKELSALGAVWIKKVEARQGKYESSLSDLERRVKALEEDKNRPRDDEVLIKSISGMLDEWVYGSESFNNTARKIITEVRKST